MVLLHDVVQVFDLPHDDLHFASVIDLVHGRFVGAALVHRDLFGNTVGLHGLVKEAQGCGLVVSGRQQKIDSLSLLVHCAVKVFSGTLDVDIGLIHAPVAAHWALLLTQHFFKQRQKPDCPTIDRRMDDKHAALLHRFLQMTIAERIG